MFSTDLIFKGEISREPEAIIPPCFYAIPAPLYYCSIFIAKLYDLKCSESMNNAERWNICASSIDLGFNPGL